MSTTALDRPFNITTGTCPGRRLPHRRMDRSRHHRRTVQRSVVSVIDGNTVGVLRDGREVRVRLEGIDCPVPAITDEDCTHVGAPGEPEQPECRSDRWRF
jgi:endonuclease YncB( thermonuclease family)